MTRSRTVRPAHFATRSRSVPNQQPWLDAADVDAPDPDVDTLAEIVQRLKLDATFLQGRDQMAIIDGRIYSKGQHLLIDGDSGKSSATLTVVNVLPDEGHPARR